jgi:hypothetical protein
MSAVQSIHIEAPVEQVFDYCRNPRNWPVLAPPRLRERVELIDAHVTDEGLGTCYVWAVRLPGFRVENFGVFTEFVPNERIVEQTSVAFEGAWTYTFDREGSGTRLTMQRHPRSFWRLRPLDALVDRFDGPATETFLATLKDVVESTGAPAEPASARGGPR